MKIKINNTYPYDIFVPAGPNAGALLQALSECVLMESKGHGSEKKWVVAPSDKQLSIAIVQDDFNGELPDPIKAALRAQEESTNRWLGEYNKRATAEKKLQELEAKLKAAGITLEPSS